MAGHGSPLPLPCTRGLAVFWRLSLGLLSLCVLWFYLLAPFALAQDRPAEGAVAAVQENILRLRLAWGGGESRAWNGTISLSEGRILDFTPLGLEADTPGSMWLTERGELRVVSRSPRTYDGCDITI